MHPPSNKFARDAASGRGGFPCAVAGSGVEPAPAIRSRSKAMETRTAPMSATGAGHRAGGAALRARKRALRPVGHCGGSPGRLLRALPLATRIRNAPHGSPFGTAPLTPPAPRERLHSMGRHPFPSFRRVARRGLSLLLRSMAARIRHHCASAHKPDAGHRACKIPIRAHTNLLAPRRCGAGMGEPFATARSRPRGIGLLPIPPH